MVEKSNGYLFTNNNNFVMLYAAIINEHVCVLKKNTTPPENAKNAENCRCLFDVFLLWNVTY